MLFKFKKEKSIEDKNKAFEMAKIEKQYRDIADKLKKVGFEKLAEKFEKKGEKIAEKVGEKIEKIRKEITKYLDSVLIKLLKIIKNEDLGKKEESIIVPIKIDRDYLSIIKEILSIEDNPYETTVEKGEVERYTECKKKLNYYKTSFPRIIFLESFPSLKENKKRIIYEEEKWGNPEYFLMLCNKEDWEEANKKN